MKTRLNNSGVSTILSMPLIILFTGCSSDDNIEQSSNKLINVLKTNKWIARDASYGIGKNDHAWLDIESTTLYFTTNDKGVVYWHQKDYDTDLGHSHNIEYNDFSYSVSGNKITTNIGNSTNDLTYSDNCIIDGSIVYHPYPMDAGDYEILNEIAPKSGTCGDKLTYTYIPKTHQLTISGAGQMNDYTPTNQPWHNYYIEEVVVEEGCTSIGQNAFTNIQHVTEIKLPSTLKSIHDNAFAGTLISEIRFPNNLTSIGNEAFSDCKYLKKVYLDDNLEEIGDFAFYGTIIKNTTLTMPNNLKSIGNYAFSGWTVGNLTLNDKLETIGNVVFSGVKGTINIPNSVKSIGNIAFEGTFNKVVIGTGLEHLTKNAFASSATTGNFYINLGVPLEMDGYIFCGEIDEYDIQRKWTLYVPKGSKNAYGNHIFWNKFKSIIEDYSLTSGNGTPSDNDNDNTTGKDEQEQNTIDAKDRRRGNVSSQFSGNGTKTSPYLIRNAADLRLLSDKCREGYTYRNEHFKLTSDIIINNNVTNSQGECNQSDYFERWIPIGCLKDSPFCGTFDGNGHTISGIFINRKIHSAVGLFGYFSGNIHNITIKDSYIESIGYTAGLVGYAFKFDQYKPMIESCINYASVKCTDGYAGGFVGRGSSCNILKSKNHGKIVTNYFAGGITGFVYEGGSTIQDCVNYGNVTGTRNKNRPCIGGIAAVLGASGSASYIYNCINKGYISANNTYEKNVSGIACLFYKGEISNCINTGYIVYDGNKGHAIISNKQGGSYSDIFYLETNGKGIGTPMTEKQMKDPSFIEKLNTNSKTLNGSYWIIDKDGLPTLKL